ncbi:MAG: DUF3054 domain-containing protein [Pseudonocardiaceae bacterium]
MTVPIVRPTGGRTVTLAAGADVLAVLVFAAVGRSSHAEGVDAFGVLSTAAPFLLGLLVGWLGARAWRAPLRLPVAVAVWVGTVVVGLGIRTVFTHRLPLTFVLVAAVSLAVFLLGWRAGRYSYLRASIGRSRAAR